MKEDILWLLNKANVIAEQWSDAIHAQCTIADVDGDPKIMAAFFYGNPKVKKLTGKDIIEEFLWYSACANALKLFAMAVYFAISSDTHPWPKRPILPTLGGAEEVK